MDRRKQNERPDASRNRDHPGSALLDLREGRGAHDALPSSAPAALEMVDGKARTLGYNQQLVIVGLPDRSACDTVSEADAALGGLEERG